MVLGRDQPPRVPHLPRPVDGAAGHVEQAGDQGKEGGGQVGEVQVARREEEVDEVGEGGEDGVHDQEPADVLLGVVVLDAGYGCGRWRW